MTRLFAMFGVSLVGWTAAIAASPWPAGAYQNPIGVGSHAKDPSVLVAAGANHLFTSYTGDPALIGNVPLQRATDLVSWQYLGDALPVLPTWVDPADPQVGGPATLIRPSLGRYLLYFSARHRDDGSPQAGWRCIGVVASASPTMLLGGSSSLIPADEPIVCNDDADAFDPSVFTFPNPNGDPHAWLVWVERRFGQPDVILHRLLAADGSDVLAPVPALPLLTAGTYIDEWELGMLANPSVVHDPGANKTYLFYSANDPVYSVDDPTVTVVIGQGGLRPTHYGTNWAVCQPTPYGVFLPCARNERAPWLRSQNGAARPGDAEVFRDQSGALWMLYDASASVSGFGAIVYQAPTLRLDKVCIAPDAKPRTTGPTTTPQSTARNANCSIDVQLLAESWPEADTLFRQDPRWRGGDGAWSIDLGDERTLWTFGDSFIDPEGVTRESSFFIRNSIAIQQGADPSTAQMTFHWKTTPQGNPTAFFPNAGAVWYWGGAGAVIGTKLLLFQGGFQLVNDEATYVHTKAVIIANYEDDPSAWVTQWFDVPLDPDGYVWIPTYAVVAGSYLYVYVSRVPEATGDANPTAALVRFANSYAKNGNFTHPRWWTGSQYTQNGPPAVLWNTAMGGSVHALPGGAHLAIMGGYAFGPGVFSTAPDRNGPFSPFQVFFAPPESSWGGSGGGAHSYLWHAHPQLSGAPVVVSYSTLGFHVLDDESPYYPKFVRFTPP